MPGLANATSLPRCQDVERVGDETAHSWCPGCAAGRQKAKNLLFGGTPERDLAAIGAHSRSPAREDTLLRKNESMKMQDFLTSYIPGIRPFRPSPNRQPTIHPRLYRVGRVAAHVPAVHGQAWTGDPLSVHSAALVLSDGGGLGQRELCERGDRPPRPQQLRDVSMVGYEADGRANVRQRDDPRRCVRLCESNRRSVMDRRRR